MEKRKTVKRFSVQSDGTFVACGAVFQPDTSGLLGEVPWVQPGGEVHIKWFSFGAFGSLARDTAGGIWVTV